MAAGSLFAILQSLGATGLGILLFGSVGAGLGLLTSSAAALGWCTCDSDTKLQEPTNNSIEKSDKESDVKVDQGIVVEKTDGIDKDTTAVNNESVKIEWFIFFEKKLSFWFQYFSILRYI